jgi:hypothetical protein
MSMVGFPLLLIPFAIYNIIAFLMPSVSFAEPLARVTLVSGAEWPITLSDILLTTGILLLLLEVMKAARPGGKYLTDHLLSFLVLGGSAAEFVMWPKFGTSTYFLLVLMAMVDFFSGIALRGRRAKVAQPAPRTAAPSRAAKEPDEPPAEPRVEPAPAPAAAPPAASPEPKPEPKPETPSAASVAESVLMDRPEPKAVHAAPAATEPAPVTPTAPAPPEAHEPAPASEGEPKSEPAGAAPHDPSPQIPSPDLQPENGTPASPETPKH